MRKLKSYEIVVATTAKWFGTVEATSRAAATRLGEDQFNEGAFRQIEEEMASIEVCEVRS